MTVNFKIIIRKNASQAYESHLPSIHLVIRWGLFIITTIASKSIFTKLLWKSLILCTDLCLKITTNVDKLLFKSIWISWGSFLKLYGIWWKKQTQVPFRPGMFFTSVFIWSQVFTEKKSISSETDENKVKVCITHV